MNYDNYYQQSFDWELTFIVGLGVFSVVILMWYFWASSYRYSSERISNKMRSKYQVTLLDNEYLSVDNAGINANNTVCAATMNIKDKGDARILRSEKVSMLVKNTCSAVQPGCVSL